MGGQVAPYEPYHPHLAYTLAITCLTWVGIYFYCRQRLQLHPRARVALVALVLALPLYAEFGSYLVFLLRPGVNTPLGATLSNIHQRVLQPLRIDWFLAPTVLALMLGGLALLLALSLVRFAYGSWQLRHALRISTPLDAAGYLQLQARFCALVAANRLACPQIAVVPLDAPLAFTTGLLRPRIYVIPQLLQLLTEDEIIAVFAHELAHVLRHDNLWNWFFRLLRDMIWFLPFSHVGWAWMVHSQDEDCDAMAARLTQEPLTLARALVKVAGAWGHSRSPLLVSMIPFAAKADVQARVEHMLAFSDDPAPGRGGPLIGACLLAGALLILAVLPTLLGS